MNLLAEDEPAPYWLANAGGRSRLLLTADHAGRAIPRRLDRLGVPETELTRHIAWDIGIAEVTKRLADALDAVAIFQTYSRLVIDCNRRPDVPSAFPQTSEATDIPGNSNLTDADKWQRQKAIFDPYHAAIDREIEARQQLPIYVAMHSFTPVYLGVVRPMHVALLYNRTPRLSQIIAAMLREQEDLIVTENEPYQVSDESDYGVPVHAERRRLDYAEIEIRQDLIQDTAGQAAWAARFAEILPRAARRLEGA